MENESIVETIREFNRIYLPILLLLDRHYLNSEYSVTDARILYEMNEMGDCSANVLAKRLHIDKSYLSRIIKRFEKEGLLKRRASNLDSRIHVLCLTKKGEKVVNSLVEKSNEQIARLTADFTSEECGEIVNAMGAIIKIFQKREDV